MGQDANGSNVLRTRGTISGKGAWQFDWSGQLAAEATTDATDAAAVTALPLFEQLTLSPTPSKTTAQTAPAAAATTPSLAADPVAAADPTANAAFGAAAHALKASAIPATSSPAYTGLYIFGGSLSDVGNAYAMSGDTSPAAPYYDGRFSNGPLWIEDLATHFGMADPTPALLGGNDFAVGGARTGATDISTTGHDLPDQLAYFDQQVPTLPAGALYSVEVGANDLIDILDSGASIAAMEAAVNQSVAAEVAFIGELASRGAANFLVPNVPDLGKAPLFNTTSIAQGATNLTAYYNATLVADLVPLAATDHINVDVVDVFSLVDQIIAAPAAYGFTNVTDALDTGSGLAATTPAGQSQYLFWDNLHPTQTAQALIAASAENLVFR